MQTVSVGAAAKGKQCSGQSTPFLNGKKTEDIEDIRKTLKSTELLVLWGYSFYMFLPSCFLASLSPTCPNLVLVVVTLAKRISGKVKDKPVKLTKTGAERRKSAEMGLGGQHRKDTRQGTR